MKREVDETHTRTRRRPTFIHTANAPVPSPNARATVSWALPQNPVVERSDASQSAHSRLSHVTTVLSSRSRLPHSRHTLMAGMMVLRCTWYTLPKPSVSL